MEICIIPCHPLSRYQKSPQHNHPLRIKSETDTRCKQQRRPWLLRPVSSAHVFIFSLCLSMVKTSGRGPCLWRTEKGTVHSNILSGAYTLSISRESISGSGWIWCREDAAALISDVLLVLFLFFHSTLQGLAAN